MSGIFFCSFGFLCVKTARNAARFSVWFFLWLWCLLILKVLLFLGIGRKDFCLP